MTVKTEGFDVDGNPVKLGDVDSMGYVVGYIDEEGSCWESCREHDLAITAGRFRDAWIKWKQDGGMLGRQDALRIARECCDDSNNVDDAVQHALNEVDPEDPLNQAISALRGRL